MKCFFSVLLCACMFFCLSACQSTEETAVSTESDTPPLETARVGATTGGTAETYCLATYPNASYFSFPATTDIVAALKAARLDYALMARLDAQNHMRADPCVCIVEDDLYPSDCAIAVAKGNTALLAQIDTVLDRYAANGALARLQSHWIRHDSSDYVIDEVPALTEGPVLRVAVCSAAEPCCFVRNGELAGLDIELIRRIAYDLGYQVEFSDMQFSALIAAVDSGRADAALSGIYMTAERAQKVGFSRCYFIDSLVLVRYDKEKARQATIGELLGESFRKNFIAEGRWKMILSGVGVTIVLSLCSGFLGFLIGAGMCLLRLRYGASGLSKAITAFTRALQGIPIVVLLMILYYVVFNESGLSGLTIASIAFGLNFGAYVSEILLSGIRAVSTEQREGALALGFTRRQVFIKVVLPQAAQHFLPVLKGEYISLVKMTSVVGYVAVQDLTKVSDIIRSRTYEAFFPLIATAVGYFLLSYALSSLLRLVEVRTDPRRRPRALKDVRL